MAFEKKVHGAVCLGREFLGQNNTTVVGVYQVDLELLSRSVSGYHRNVIGSKELL